MSMLVVVVVVVAMLAVAVAYLARVQRNSTRWPSDAEGLAELRRNGIDLSKPRAFEFYLHFPSREIALKAERVIADEGYEVQVSAGPGLPVAILCATKSLVPREEELRAVRAQLVALSHKFGGSYEGWFAAAP